MDITTELKNYKNILKNSYSNPKPSVSYEQKSNLKNSLAKTGLASSDNILKIASILNRKSGDYYFITYALLVKYNDKSMVDINSNKTLSANKKDDALEEACELISKNIDNKEFIDRIYTDIRLGSDIEKIYYPKQLKKELTQLKHFTTMLNKLNNSEKF